jgi:hypothetical protein
MCALPAENWLRLLAWLAIGFAIYRGYGRVHSVMGRQPATAGGMVLPMLVTSPEPPSA